MWGATSSLFLINFGKNFNPRAPCGARLASCSSRRPALDISIHAPRVGRDQPSEGCAGIPCYFNPRAPCGARLEYGEIGYEQEMISIHAPRVGRDQKRIRKTTLLLISIHAPRVGRDAKVDNPPANNGAFQSTRPVWGATGYVTNTFDGLKFQSTRPVWGATARLTSLLSRRSNFNPRAPCGARRACLRRFWPWLGFQSTRPVWGATRRGHRQLPEEHISIHAPRVGRDYNQLDFRHKREISIHAPRVGRDAKASLRRFISSLFQSTRPVWGATTLRTALSHIKGISIHAPRVGRDVKNHVQEDYA